MELRTMPHSIILCSDGAQAKGPSQRLSGSETEDEDRWIRWVADFRKAGQDKSVGVAGDEVWKVKYQEKDESPL